jgi:halocyanin-like protein
MDDRTSRRRTFIATGAAAVAGLLAGCAGGDGGDETDPETDATTAEGGNETGGNETSENETDGNETDGNESGGGGQQPSFDGWFEDTSNYDGVVDRTGEESPTVMVGAEGNGGNFAFEPAAIRIDAGTTVVWEWTGEGSSHNVKADDDSFESEYYDSAGETFEHTFEEAGTYEYVCVPHQAQGMKGAVVVE